MSPSPQRSLHRPGASPWWLLFYRALCCTRFVHVPNVLSFKKVTGKNCLQVVKKSRHICFVEAGGTGHAGGLRSANRQRSVAFKEVGEPVFSRHLGVIPSVWVFASTSDGQFIGTFPHLKQLKSKENVQRENIYYMIKI